MDDEISKLLDDLRETVYRASYKGQMYDIRSQVTLIRIRYHALIQSNAIKERICQRELLRAAGEEVGGSAVWD